MTTRTRSRKCERYLWSWEGNRGEREMGVYNNWNVLYTRMKLSKSNLHESLKRKDAINRRINQTARKYL